MPCFLRTKNLSEPQFLWSRYDENGNYTQSYGEGEPVNKDEKVE